MTWWLAGAAILLTSAGVGWALTPWVAASQRAADLLDHPNHRSSHAVPTPRAGGPAAVVAVALGALVAAALVPWGWPGWLASSSVVVTVGVLAAVGWADDRVALPALPRLMAQVVCGAALGAAAGSVAGHTLWLAIVGALVTPLVVNVVNFVDGINGITGGTMAVWGVTTALAGAHVQDAVLLTAGCAVAGSALGFLPHNVPRASAFLGDSGSYLYGAAASMGVLVAASHSWKVAAVVAAPLLLQVVDVLSTLARRAARGVNLMEAHREHAYQRLSDRVGSHILVAVAIASGGAVIAAAMAADPMLGASAGLLLATTYLYLGRPSPAPVGSQVRG